MSLRARAAKAMAATLNGVARGSDRGNLLEQGRSKLLYGPVPRGFNTRTELDKRFSTKLLLMVLTWSCMS